MQLTWRRDPEEEGGWQSAQEDGNGPLFTIRKGRAPSGYYDAWRLYGPQRGKPVARPGTLTEAKKIAQGHVLQEGS